MRNPFRRWRCWFRHDWDHYQETFVTDSRFGVRYESSVVIAFKVCHRCAHSKLMHILK